MGCVRARFLSRRKVLPPHRLPMHLVLRVALRFQQLLAGNGRAERLCGVEYRRAPPRRSVHEQYGKQAPPGKAEVPPAAQRRQACAEEYQARARVALGGF